jgi:hypothetical protein
MTGYGSNRPVETVPAIMRLLRKAAPYALREEPVPIDILADLDDAGYVLEALPLDLARLNEGLVS